MGKVLPLLVAALLLAGCASKLDRLDAATEEFHAKLRPARMMIQYDLTSTDGLSEIAQQHREREVAKAFLPACVKPYSDKLFSRLATVAQHAKERGIAALPEVDGLPGDARVLDKEFDVCIRQYGAIGFNFLALEDGSHQRVPEYLERGIEAMHAYGETTTALVNERGDGFSALNLVAPIDVGELGTGSNPNSHYVGPYVRNGSLVRGHYQTNPNGTQYDNYSTRGDYDPYTGAYGTHTPSH